MKGSITLLVETLVASGCTPEMILAAVRTAEATKDDALEKSRENTRNRVKKWRETHRVTLQNVTKRSVTAHASVSPAPDLENKQTNKQEKKKETRASDEAAFRAELASDLPDELLDGIIKVRRDKRGQVTGLSARCFRDDAAECGMSVHDAAKACVTSSWITVKPHYFYSRAGPTGRKRNFVDVAIDRVNGHGSKGIFSTDGDAQRLPSGSREPGPDDGNLRGGIAGRYITSGH